MSKSRDSRAWPTTVPRSFSPLSARPGFPLSPFRPLHLWKGKRYAPLVFTLIALTLLLAVQSSLAPLGQSLCIPIPGEKPVEIPLDRIGQTLVNFAGGLEAFESDSFLQGLQSDMFPHQADVDGILHVSTRSLEGCRLEVPEGYASQTTGTIVARRVWPVTVADEGCGIEKDDLAKICRPLFTTKPEGQETGPGLYVAGNIVMEHKGTLTAASRGGEVTVFHVALPSL